MPDFAAILQQEAQEPVAWLNPWRADQVTTDYDAYGERGIPLYTAPQPSPTAQAAECVTAPAGVVGPDGMMRDELRSMIEGMSVSVDVSTGDHDAGHRYFGTVTEVMECQGNKHGVTLLVQDAEPNFTATTTAPSTPSSTAQSADSVPAVSDLPPLPAPDLRDVGTKPQEIKEFLKGYATEYARTAIAARAQADSVQEDAARVFTYKNQPCNNVTAWRFGEACRAAQPGGDPIDHGLSLLQKLQERGYGIVAIDAARKQGANHD